MSTEMDGLKRSRVLNSYKILAAHFVEKNSIEGGSKVRITREWERGENGCSCSFFPKLTQVQYDYIKYEIYKFN